MRKPEATTFGGLLTNFQKQRKLAIELAHRELKKRNQNKAVTGKYRIEETSAVGLDGSTIHSLKFWALIDEEHIKISTNVEATTLGKADDEIKNLLS